MKNIKLDLTSRKGRHCVTPIEGTCEEGYIMLYNNCIFQNQSRVSLLQRSSGRADRVMDSHTTGPGLRLGGNATISTERLTTTITAS